VTALSLTKSTLSLILYLLVWSSSGPDSLARATVTGLPPDVVPKPAENTEESRLPVVLQPHTKPSRDFASDVGLSSTAYADDQIVDVKVDFIPRCYPTDRTSTESGGGGRA